MASNPPTSPGNFSFPPPGSHLQFNYIDSVITSWLVFDTDPIDCLLSLYYWPGADPWTLGLNQTATANSTGILPLAFADGDYLGQFNFNYNASDGSSQRILSPIFSVDNSPQSKAVTWSQGVLALPTPSESAVPPTSSVSLVTSSHPQATKTTFNEITSVLISSATSSSLPITSPSPIEGSSSATPSSLPVSSQLSTKGSSLGTGAIAGIVVGIIVCAGFAVALIFYRLRRKPSDVLPEPHAPPPPFFQSQVPVIFLGEKDGSSVPPRELSAGSQLFEMASENRRGSTEFINQA